MSSHLGFFKSLLCRPSLSHTKCSDGCVIPHLKSCKVSKCFVNHQQKIVSVDSA